MVEGGIKSQHLGLRKSQYQSGPLTLLDFVDFSKSYNLSGPQFSLSQ